MCLNENIPPSQFIDKFMTLLLNVFVLLYFGLILIHLQNENNKFYWSDGDKNAILNSKWFWTNRAISLNEYNDRTLYGNLVHNIHIYVVFHRYGCVDAPKHVQKLDCKKFNKGNCKNGMKEKWNSHKPLNHSFYEILSRIHHKWMVYLWLPYVIPCAFLN